MTALGILLLLAGCSAPEGEPTATPSPPATTQQPPGAMTPEATPPVIPTKTLPQGPPVVPYAAGIWFREPAPASALRLIGGDAPQVALPPGGFDIRGTTLLHGDNDRTLRLVFENGTERALRVPSLHHVGRASLSPDGSRALVQATLTAADPPANFDIFVVDLVTGEARAVSGGEMNEESPEWSPAGDMIAYSSFSAEEGVNLHLVRPNGAAHLSIRDAGGIHLAFSPNGSRILEVGRLRVYDVESGELVDDLRGEALAGLAAAGYEPDARYPGQAGRGTFPLDGAFSPDGSRVVFDGAVLRDGAPGVVIATMGADGSGFEIVAGAFAVDPATTNGLNYSETNPLWR